MDQVQAYAGTLGFEAEIQAIADPNLLARHNEVFDETTADGIKKVKAKRQNEYAFHTYMPAFSTEDLLNKIESGKTPEWPGGLAQLVTKELKEEFRPKDTISRVVMWMTMARITMSKKWNPKKLRERLKTLSNLFNNYKKKINDDDLVATILIQAPEQYAPVLVIAQQNASKENRDLIVKELIEIMCYQWRITEGMADEVKKEGN